MLIDCAVDSISFMASPYVFCDSHTHLVFAAWRENEFVDRIKGMSYEEIAKPGGGILNSAAKLQASSEDQLFELAIERLYERRDA